MTIDEMITEAANKYGLDAGLLRRQFKQESGLNPDAVSPKGALGVAQVMPKTGKALGYSEEDLKDPAKNIEAGAKFMAQMYDHARKANPSLSGKDLDAAALAAYNAGPTGALKYIKSGDTSDLVNETRTYINKILARKPAAQEDSGVSDIVAAFNKARSQGQDVQAATATPAQAPAPANAVDSIANAFLQAKKEQPAPAQQEPQQQGSLAGYTGAVTRGLAPTAAGATLGAMAGAPLAGVGAVPGALAGAGAGFLTQVVGDPAVMAVNKLFGTNYATPSESLNLLLDKLGVARPETGGQELAQAVTSGLASGGLGAPAAAQTIAKVATSPVTKAVATQMAANPAIQAISGGTGAAAADIVRQEGGNEWAQMAAGLLGGLGGGVGAAKAGRVAQAAKTPVPANPTVQAGEAAGIPVMTSDVSPPQTFLSKQAQAVGERIPVIGTQGQRAAQQEARQAAVQNVAEQYGAPSYEEIAKNLKGNAGKVKQAAGRVIDQTGNKLDQAGEVVPQKSLAAIDDAIAQLSKPEVFNPAAEGQIATLQQLRSTLEQGQTFSTLKQSRTGISDVLDSVDPSGRSQLPSYAKKLVTQVRAAMSDDMKDIAKNNLSEQEYSKWVKANQVYGEEANLLKNSRLKNVLDKADITPEQVRTLIYSNKPSENKILYDALSKTGRDNVRSAFINDAFEKATASGEINPNRFAAELAKHDKKIDIFFKGDERDQVKGLVDVLQRTARAQRAAEAPTTTGAALTPYALGASAFADFGATLASAISAGTVSRIYESPVVRDLILKLNKTPQNSGTEAALASQLATASRIAEQGKESKKKQQKPKF